MPGSEPLLLLHLSDLHFGAKSRFAGEDPRNVARAFHAGIAKAVEAEGLVAANQLFIITGDLVETAIPPEYDQARLFFDELVELLELPDRRLERRSV